MIEKIAEARLEQKGYTVEVEKRNDGQLVYNVYDPSTNRERQVDKQKLIEIANTWKSINNEQKEGEGEGVKKGMLASKLGDILTGGPSLDESEVAFS